MAALLPQQSCQANAPWTRTLQTHHTTPHHTTTPDAAQASAPPKQHSMVSCTSATEQEQLAEPPTHPATVHAGKQLHQLNTIAAHFHAGWPEAPTPNSVEEMGLWGWAQASRRNRGTSGWRITAFGKMSRTQ
jgi:hypothetical protein